MRLGGFFTSVLLLLSATFGLAGGAHSSVIANWDKGNRSWNNSHMTSIKESMAAVGHRVEADAPITPTAAAAAAVYILGEPTAVPNASELDLLRRFINAGGIVLIFGDTGINLSTYNSILTGLGSAITFIPSTIATTSALADGKFTRAPNNIIGGSLAVTPGNGTAGGTLVDTNYVRFEQLGAGHVVVFGDRLDLNEFISPTNTSLLLNIVSFAVGPPTPVPALSLYALIGLALLAGMVAAVRLRRGRAPV